MLFRYKVTGNPKHQAFPTQADPVAFESGTATIQRFNQADKRIPGTIELQFTLSKFDNPRTVNRYLYKVTKATKDFSGTKGKCGILNFSQVLLQYPVERIHLVSLTATFTT
jgi:hypothetical protein